MSTRLGVLAASLIVLGATASAAAAQRTFRPRIGAAMGIVPAVGHQEIAAGSNIPVLYHGGSVMRAVTIHTVFWAPSGFRFDGPPSGSGPDYEQLIQQFFTDVAHDSGATDNVFSVLDQYADRRGAGSYGISYDAPADSLVATDPYPHSERQCASPDGVATCVTDLELEQEIDKLIRAHDPAGRGLSNIWFVFLPPNVDTCVSPGSCGSNVYAGYHSLLNLGHGPTVYAVVPDELIEGVPVPGADPQGNPEAEFAIDTAAHEAVEAITDPEGTGWIDPNGFEVGDECENGPQQGTPLGFAADGSPYDQLINGHQYLIQTIWSNTAHGCVQSSTARNSSLPLATVNLRQFSSSLSGNIGTLTRGVSVGVTLIRAGTLVAVANARTGPTGGWGPVSLRSTSRSGHHAVGDDRDVILVDYGRRGPEPDLIGTGNGGNPFTEAGWTGWFDLDNGYAVGSRSVLLAPCGQTGVLGLTVNGAPMAPPVAQCETESDVSVVSTRPLRDRTTLGMSSEDNRALSALNPNGALVKLTIPLGEPNSVSALGNAQVLFEPTGFPLCTANLEAQAVRCTGLVSGQRYALTRRRGDATRHARADSGGTAMFLRFPGSTGIQGGDALRLSDSGRRALTVLHVAHLRVNLDGEQTRIASGTCEPGDYYGASLSAPPSSSAAGLPGAGGTGTICPPSGHARGLSTADIAQTDEESGGQTRTQVPDIEGTSPLQDETLYGPFVALAQVGLPGPGGATVPARARVALTITRPSGGQPLFRATNVDTAQGVAAGALAPGVYVAKWVLTDANGDTRTLRTRFVHE